MNFSTRRTIIGLAITASTAALCGCSGNSGALQTTCGPGTSLIGAQCVPNTDSGTANGTDASGGAENPADGAGGPGADGTTGGDAGAPPGAGDAAASSSDASIDGPAGDADPCFVDLNFSTCDKSCAQVPPVSCPQSTCGKMVTAQAAPGVPNYLRTPPAPGVDPACAAACPSGGFVWGVGVQVLTGDFIVKTPPHWQVIANSQTPFCPDSHSTTSSCAYFPHNAMGILYLVTDDPNSPARNIEFRAASSNTCPPEG